MSTSTEAIQQAIEENGYVTINIEDTYYYTVGMGSQGKPELFALGHFPFSLFQCIAQDYKDGKLTLNQIGHIEEFKIPGFGMEPAQVFLSMLAMDTSATIKQYLATPVQDYKYLGSVYVHGPDVNNWHSNHPKSLVQLDPDEAVQRLFSETHATVRKTLNEAQRVIEQMKKINN